MGAAAGNLGISRLGANLSYFVSFYKQLLHSADDVGHLELETTRTLFSEDDSYEIEAFGIMLQYSLDGSVALEQAPEALSKIWEVSAGRLPARLSPTSVHEHEHGELAVSFMTRRLTYLTQCSDMRTNPDNGIKCPPNV